MGCLGCNCIRGRRGLPSAACAPFQGAGAGDRSRSIRHRLRRSPLRHPLLGRSKCGAFPGGGRSGRGHNDIVQVEHRSLVHYRHPGTRARHATPRRCATVPAGAALRVPGALFNLNIAPRSAASSRTLACRRRSTSTPAARTSVSAHTSASGRTSVFRVWLGYRQSQR